MIKAFDFKKEYKDIYLPKTKPVLIDIPSMNYIMVSGTGNPNEEDGEYKKAIELLYSLSYTIKMSKMGTNKISGYFEYVVPPLEGLWWLKDEKDMDFINKDKYCWISMIRQPDFVTSDVFNWACIEVQNKKGLNSDNAMLKAFTEGLTVQILHIGDYSNEPKTLEVIDEYIKENNLKKDIGTVLSDGNIRRHHEIYLSDPRKTKREDLKTILRIPVAYK